MSNEDLEKDMEQRNAKTSGNQEHVNKSSASEGSLLHPSEDPASVKNLVPEDKEAKLDPTGNIITEEDSQDGSMPDPEEAKLWENKDDSDKMSG